MFLHFHCPIWYFYKIQGSTHRDFTSWTSLDKIHLGKWMQIFDRCPGNRTFSPLFTASRLKLMLLGTSDTFRGGKSKLKHKAVHRGEELYCGCFHQPYRSVW